MKKNRKYSCEWKFFSEIFKIRSDFFFGKDFPNIIEETHREMKEKGFSLQKGRRVFFMQKTTESTENTQKRERKKG